MLKFLPNRKKFIENITYVALLELFIIISPIFTYPFLIRTIGVDTYSKVILAHVIASYAVIFINLGYTRISAKDISIHRDNKEKLSEIISIIFFVRLIAWIVVLILYSIIIYSVHSYREYFLLYFISFGITINELLFPQYYFQGIEQLKHVTYARVTTSFVGIILIFMVINDTDDYLYVPIIKVSGFLLSGLYSVYVIFFRHRLRLIVPNRKLMKDSLVEAAPIFSTELITSIKDKLSYILISTILGGQQLIIYDLGSKFNNLLVKPASVISRVLYPQMAQSRNSEVLKKILLTILILMILAIIIFNLFLEYIVGYFLVEQVNLAPFRLYSLAPLMLSISTVIASNGLLVFGRSKHLLKSIIVTTIVYIGSTIIFYLSNKLNSVNVFIIITLLAYLSELLYRWFVLRSNLMKST